MRLVRDRTNLPSTAAWAIPNVVVGAFHVDNSLWVKGFLIHGGPRAPDPAAPSLARFCAIDRLNGRRRLDSVELWVLVLLGAAGGCLIGVLGASLFRRRSVADELPDVVELAHELAKLKRQVRGAFMQRVREGASFSPESSSEAPPAPPELQPGATLPDAPGLSPRAVKDRLRAAVFSSSSQRRQ